MSHYISLTVAWYLENQSAENKANQYLGSLH
jgi:hypothetical protein